MIRRARIEPPQSASWPKSEREERNIGQLPALSARFRANLRLVEFRAGLSPPRIDILWRESYSLRHTPSMQGRSLTCSAPHAVAASSPLRERCVARGHGRAGASGCRQVERLACARVPFLILVHSPLSPPACTAAFGTVTCIFVCAGANTCVSLFFKLFVCSHFLRRLETSGRWCRMARSLRHMGGCR